MPDTPVIIHSFPSAPELADYLADEIAGNLENAVTERQQASLVVSGGSTPRFLFNRLSLKTINWQKVTITLADERWVDTRDTSSNELLVRSHLLQNEAAGARFIGLKNNAPTAVIGEHECHESVNSIQRPFDMVILGMGDDGHTASLFPGSPELESALDMQSGRHCIALTPQKASHERITMTLPTLLDSRGIILYITGSRKRKVLDKAFGDGAANDMPVRWILRQQRTPVQIVWAP